MKHLATTATGVAALLLLTACSGPATSAPASVAPTGGTTPASADRVSSPTPPASPAAQTTKSTPTQASTAAPVTPSPDGALVALRDYVQKQSTMQWEAVYALFVEQQKPTCTEAKYVAMMEKEAGTPTITIDKVVSAVWAPAMAIPGSTETLPGYRMVTTVTANGQTADVNLHPYWDGKQWRFALSDERYATCIA